MKSHKIKLLTMFAVVLGNDIYSSEAPKVSGMVRNFKIDSLDILKSFIMSIDPEASIDVSLSPRENLERLSEWMYTKSPALKSSGEMSKDEVNLYVDDLIRGISAYRDKKKDDFRK